VRDEAGTSSGGSGVRGDSVRGGSGASDGAGSRGGSGDTRCHEPRPGDDWIEKLGGYPVVVKPLLEGSTVGLTIVKDPADWDTAWRNGASFAHPTRGLLVEEYIPGREITVAIVTGEALPVIEIVPKSGFYDFEHKYTKGETEYLVPAPLPEATASRLQELALTAFRTLGCRDLARVDFRLTEAGEPYCLEINTLPGMTATSLVPMASRTIGIEFDELLEILSRIAMSRQAGGGAEGQ
jgi:D-alanine-D-alanine ligase